MEKTLNILAIGRQADIMEVMHRLLNAKEDRKGTTVTSDEAAIEAFGKETYDIVMLCAGVSEQEETALQQQFRQIDPAIVVIRHYGGGSGLLENEIQTVLTNRSL